MHPIHRAIGNTQLILPTNGIDNGQAQAGGTFLLLSLIETIEDALAVQQLAITRISETDAGGSDDDTDFTFIYIMHECILQQISHQHHRQGLVHPDAELTFLFHREPNASIIVYFAIIVHIPMQNLVDADL